ncbi:uncharacterized protein K452DRAFT_289681, partial [Aplosporella prunicola CBS 121167]
MGIYVGPPAKTSSSSFSSSSKPPAAAAPKQPDLNPKLVEMIEIMQEREAAEWAPIASGSGSEQAGSRDQDPFDGDLDFSVIAGEAELEEFDFEAFLNG